MKSWVSRRDRFQSKVIHGKTSIEKDLYFQTTRGKVTDSKTYNPTLHTRHLPLLRTVRI